MDELINLALGNSGQLQSGFNFDRLLKALAGPNPFLSAGINLGSSLLKGLGGLVSGPSQSEKSARQVFNLAQNRLGQSVLDPNQFFAQYMRALVPQFNRGYEIAGNRVGLDSGVAIQEGEANREFLQAGLFGDIAKFNAQATANSDLQLLSTMLGAAQLS